ncbi:MAG: carbamoyl-phosphate synthase large subunit [Planctomycetota bacterium]|jgi:carbamoyl-phosphate synthase large subunit
MHATDLVVGISGLDSGTNPHPGTAVAMALRNDPDFHGRLIALSYDPMVPGAFMNDLFDDFGMVPWPGDHESYYMSALAGLQQRFGLNVFLPCLDSDLPTVSRLQGAFHKLGVHTLVPHEDSVKSRFKWNLTELCRRANLKTPRTIVLYDTAQLHPLDGWSWPVFIKGALADAELANDQEEADYLFLKMARKWGYPVLAQESRAGVEYLVAGVMGRKGLLGKVSVKKGATTLSGKAKTGVTVNNSILNEVTTQLLAAMNWCGPFELEFMLDAASGEFLLIEINGRFPAWISFATDLGSPLVRLAVLEAAGMDPEPIPDPEGGIHFTRAHLQSTGECRDLKIWNAVLQSSVSATCENSNMETKKSESNS